MVRDYGIIDSFYDECRIYVYNQKRGSFLTYVNERQLKSCVLGDLVEVNYDDDKSVFLKNVSQEQRIDSFDKAYKRFDPLYANKENEKGYICQITGNNCKTATDYFKSLRKLMEQSAKDGRAFITKECNLCAENECPIWYKTIHQITEFAKQKSK